MNAEKGCDLKNQKKEIILIIVVAVITLVLTVTANGFGAVSAVNAYGKKQLPIYSVERDDKLISISFDCAWGVEYTDKLLEEMERYGVKCTFFPVQFWTEKYPEYVEKIDLNGHEFGTHSATHSHMPKLSEKDIVSELNASAIAIEKITGKKVTLFRPPYGDYNDKLILTSRKNGYEVIQWDVDSLDWKNLSADEIASRVISKVKSGSIILCHNNGLHTAEALPLIFSDLQAKGYKFVPIGELILKGNYNIDNNGRQHADS